VSDWFVGFRPSPKSPGNVVTHRFRLTVMSTRPISDIFTDLTTREGIDSLIDQTVRFDARHGGKLRFISSGDDGYGGTYSRISVPKRVVLLTEKHGEVDIRLQEKSDGCAVTVTARWLGSPEAKSSWEGMMNQLVSDIAQGSVDSRG
jgi:hypothetical protein